MSPRLLLAGAAAIGVTIWALAGGHLDAVIMGALFAALAVGLYERVRR